MNDQLWEHDRLRVFVARVEAFEIDSDDKTLRFVDRLARENRWSIPYAQRVIREYLRFCILAMRCDHPVTPSEAVDQAWHLHLTYTRSYWERFCGETLGGPLHHEPTAGGPDEGDKFRDWYGQTLDSYRHLFGDNPPRDVWPSTGERFAHAGELKWINSAREWAVSKRLVAWSLGTVGCAVAAALFRPGNAGDFQVAAGLPIGAAAVQLDLSDTDFLLFYGALVVIGLVAIVGLRVSASASEGRDPSPDDVGELSTEELAVLSGGASRLAHVALTRLFAEGRIEAAKTMWWYGKFRVVGPSPKGPAIVRDLYGAIKADTPPSQLMAVVKPHFERIDVTLKEKGLRRTSMRKSKAATWVTLFIGLIGGLRMVQGIVLGEDFGYLAVMTIAFVVVATLLNVTRFHATPKGRAYLERITSTYEPDAIAGANPEPAALALGVAVLGTSAIDNVEGLAPLSSLAPSVGRSSSAGGGGCGGGCGGGGCGGCGG